MQRFTVTLGTFHLAKWTLLLMPGFLYLLFGLEISLAEARPEHTSGLAGVAAGFSLSENIIIAWGAVVAMGLLTGAMYCALKRQAARLKRMTDDRQNLQSELEETGSKTRAIISSLGELIFILDIDNRFIEYYNPVRSPELFIPPEMFIGKKIDEIGLPADVVQSYMQSIEQIKKEDILQSFDYSLESDISRKWYNASLSRFRSVNEEIGFLGCVAVVHDITERKDFELALKESERTYREIFNATNDAIFIHDAITGDIVDANERVLTLYGYKPEELQKMSVQEISEGKAPYSVDDALEIMQRTMDEGPQVFNWRARKKNGGLFWVEVGIRKFEISGSLYLLAAVRDINDRIKGQETLYRTEERLRKYYELPLIGMAIIGANGEWLNVNAKLCEMLGYGEDEMLSRTWDELTPPEEWRLERPLYRPIFQGVKDGLTIEKTFHSKDGSSIYVGVSLLAVRDSNDEVDYFVAIIQDITSRKNAEDALRESEQRLSQIIDFLPDATMAIDKCGTVIAWNHAMEDMTGVGAADMLGRGDFAHALPFYGHSRPLLVDLALTPEEAGEGLYPHVRREGDVVFSEAFVPMNQGPARYLSGKARPLYDSRGEIVGAIEAIRDVTERFQVEEALRQSETTYRALFENSGTAYMFVEEDHTISLINIQMEHLLGYTREEMEGKHRWTEFVADPEQLAKMREYHVARRSEPGNAPDSYETRLKDRFGREFDALITATLIPGTMKTLATITDISQLRNAERALKASENRYRAIFENTGTASIIIDSDTTILLANTEWLNLTGYSREETENQMSWTVFVHPEDLVMMRGYHDQRRVDSSNVPQKYEFRFFDRTGNMRYILNTVNMIPGSRHSIASLMDITDLKNAEQALRESAAKYRLIFDNSPLGLFHYDERGVITACNDNFVSIIGSTREEIVGLDTKALPDKTVVEAIDLSLRGDQGFYDGLYHSTTAEKTTPIRGIFTPLQTPEGMIMGGVGILEDVTERHRAEEERNRLQRLLINIIDSMPSVLVGVDNEGLINQWNAEAEKITSVHRAQAEGMPVNAVLPILSECGDSLARALNEGITNKVEKLKCYVDGRPIFYDLTIYPLEEAEKRGAVIRLDDITEKVRLEDIMIQTEKMMSVGGLAAGMAHEINNPLGGIIQGVQNIARRLDPDLEQNHKTARDIGLELDQIRAYLECRQILKFLDGIRQSGIRAAKIVNNMLQFSRIGEVEHRRCSLPRLLDGALELASNDYDLKKKYDFRHVQVIKKYHPLVDEVWCAETEIEQVILNLLKNAAQAMMEAVPRVADPQIIIRTYPRGPFVVIEIEDNGPGMDESTMRRVFEPFYTTKPVGAGTGLGLSVSYFIVTENHQGHIFVESSPGRGARFVVELPREGKTHA